VWIAETPQPGEACFDLNEKIIYPLQIGAFGPWQEIPVGSGAYSIVAGYFNQGDPFLPFDEALKISVGSDRRGRGSFGLQCFARPMGSDMTVQRNWNADWLAFGAGAGRLRIVSKSRSRGRLTRGRRPATTFCNRVARITKGRP
jgi:hypothetical protein